MKDILYVNDNDKVVGQGPIQDYVRLGYCARVSKVFITNGVGQLLIQKRSKKVVSSPSKWDQSAAGHVDKGESYLQAAKRELFEEMGINAVDLKEIAEYQTSDDHPDGLNKRFFHIFTGSYDGEVKIDKKEVSDYRWISLMKLEEWMNKNPEDFTRGFVKAYNILKNKT